ncbi:hypothetical protein KCP78_18710 [Salmonella enterica subsp. enterica]|nr:hypothetical protein KCP78_18710 [Salmonella enterica subsp. enterica]
MLSLLTCAFPDDPALPPHQCVMPSSPALAPDGCFPTEPEHLQLRDRALTLPLQDFRRRARTFATSALTPSRRCSTQRFQRPPSVSRATIKSSSVPSSARLKFLRQSRPDPFCAAGRHPAAQISTD